MPDGSLFTAAKSGVQKKVRRTSSPSQVVHSALDKKGRWTKKDMHSVLHLFCGLVDSAD
jgi:Ser-tRNA(Ala) deacylase AlaX